MSHHPCADPTADPGRVPHGYATLNFAVVVPAALGCLSVQLETGRACLLRSATLRPHHSRVVECHHPVDVRAWRPRLTRVVLDRCSQNSHVGQASHTRIGHRRSLVHATICPGPMPIAVQASWYPWKGRCRLGSGCSSDTGPQTRPVVERETVQVC